MLKIPSKSSKSDGNSNLKGMTGKPILFLAGGSNERSEAFGRPQCHPRGVPYACLTLESPPAKSRTINSKLTDAQIPSKSSKFDGNSNLKGMTGKPILFFAEGVR